MNFLDSRLSKVRALQTDRQTYKMADVTKNIDHPAFAGGKCGGGNGEFRALQLIPLGFNCISGSLEWEWL